MHQTVGAFSASGHAVAILQPRWLVTIDARHLDTGAVRQFTRWAVDADEAHDLGGDLANEVRDEGFAILSATVEAR
ncbi:hypothetical protein [Gemmatimonas sp.]